MIAWWWIPIVLFAGIIIGGILAFVFAISDAISDSEERWKGDE